MGTFQRGIGGVQVFGFSKTKKNISITFEVFFGGYFFFLTRKTVVFFSEKIFLVQETIRKALTSLAEKFHHFLRFAGPLKPRRGSRGP